jgi:predicted acetyltransferase
MKLVKCTLDNIPLLAQLNKQLFEDENNDSIPKIEVLEERLQKAMNEGSAAYLFMINGTAAGYALVKIQVNPYYLSHFFICREFRRQHLGTTAFNKLMTELNTNSIDLDVFCWNEWGRAFWKSLGFKERAVIMRKLSNN